MPLASDRGWVRWGTAWGILSFAASSPCGLTRWAGSSTAPSKRRGVHNVWEIVFPSYFGPTKMYIWWNQGQPFFDSWKFIKFLKMKVIFLLVKRRVRIARFLYWVSISSRKYTRMIKNLYFQIWFVAGFA
jgi:hypothetical protein